MGIKYVEFINDVWIPGKTQRDRGMRKRVTPLMVDSLKVDMVNERLTIESGDDVVTVFGSNIADICGTKEAPAKKAKPE